MTAEKAFRHCQLNQRRLPRQQFSATSLGRSAQKEALRRPEANESCAYSFRLRLSRQCRGQGCIYAKRFLVAAPLLEAFTKAFVEQSKALPMGDPVQEGIELGPLARGDLRRNVQRQVQDAEKAGAGADGRRDPRWPRQLLSGNGADRSTARSSDRQGRVLRAGRGDLRVRNRRQGG